jgi:hypothetical protein
VRVVPCGPVVVFSSCTFSKAKIDRSWTANSQEGSLCLSASAVTKLLRVLDVRIVRLCVVGWCVWSGEVCA